MKNLDFKMGDGPGGELSFPGRRGGGEYGSGKPRLFGAPSPAGGPRARMKSSRREYNQTPFCFGDGPTTKKLITDGEFIPQGAKACQPKGD